LRSTGWEWDSCLSGEDEDGVGGCEDNEDESFYAGSDLVEAAGRSGGLGKASGQRPEARHAEDSLAASLGRFP
jgi:hypothetical protein